MKKRLIIIVLSILLLVSLVDDVEEKFLVDPTMEDIENIATIPLKEEEITEPVIIEPTYKEVLSEYLDPSLEYKENLSKEENISEREKLEEYLLTLYEAAFNVVSEEDIEEAIAFVRVEINRIAVIHNKYHEEYISILEEEEIAAKWQARMEEYPTATTVWKHLTEIMGCNDYVAAGIIGNMMAECGGQTLSLNWRAKNATGHYGLCQWSTGFVNVQGDDLQGQLDFMVESFPQQINRWGDICYKDDFTYEDFMAMEDAEEVAYAFCVIYERPGPGSYDQRRANALRAYEYFTS